MLLEVIALLAVLLLNTHKNVFFNLVHGESRRGAVCVQEIYYSFHEDNYFLPFFLILLEASFSQRVILISQLAKETNCDDTSIPEAVLHHRITRKVFL